MILCGVILLCLVYPADMRNLPLDASSHTTWNVEWSDPDLRDAFPNDPHNTMDQQTRELKDKIVDLLEKLQDYMPSHQDIDDDYMNFDEERHKRANGAGTRMKPREMRNVLNAMPAELVSHILQGHRMPPEEMADSRNPSGMRGTGGLSVGLDLDALSGMIANMRRKTYGEKLRQSHKKLLDIGRK